MRKQLGQSMTEFLVVMPVMLLLILGAIQFILIYQTKTTLNYATFEAARAGSLENASRVAIDNGFTRGLAPLFARFATTIDDDPSKDYSSLANNAIAARNFARQEVEDGFVQIELLNPTPAMFQAFPNNEIPNDHLGFRPEVNSISVQDANLLKIRITYCMKLIVPMIDNIITAAAGGNCNDPNASRFPIVSTSLIRMQSNAILCRGCFD